MSYVSREIRDDVIAPFSVYLALWLSPWPRHSPDAATFLRSPPLQSITVASSSPVWRAPSVLSVGRPLVGSHSAISGAATPFSTISPRRRLHHTQRAASARTSSYSSEKKEVRFAAIGNCVVLYTNWGSRAERGWLSPNPDTMDEPDPRQTVGERQKQ